MRLFSMNLSQTRARLVKAGAAFAAAALVAGCGSQYRPVVTPINPSGPPAQPNSLAVVVSSSSLTTPGIATIIDYSGDTIMATAPIGPGPTSFTLDGPGSTGYTVNSDRTVTNFPASTNLQEKNVLVTTLPTTAQSTGLFSPATGLWAVDQCSMAGNVCTSAVDVFTGSPQTFKLSIPVAATPIAVVGPATAAQRNYSLSLNNSKTPAGSVIPYTDMTCNNAPRTVTQTGEADSLEVSTYTVSARIPLGKCPVYAVQNNDSKRLFVLNRGDDTVTVINSQNNTLDECAPFVSQTGRLVTCHPTLPLSLTAVNALNAIKPGSGNPPNGSAGMTAIAGPVYAEYNTTTGQLIVADYDGGTISVIDVSLDIYGNDSETFGTTFTIPVGKNPAVAPYPASVTVLNDGSRAYTANQAEGSVTIVNLSSHTVVTTLPVTGHPRTVVSTSNSLYGKVYVASPDSPYLTILRTDQDIVDTTVLVQGSILDVRVSSPNGTGSNINVTSRRPGAGQPCYLPPPVPATLATCQTLP